MVSLSDETQRLIEQQMRETGVGTPDELVRLALQTLHQTRGEDVELLDEETRHAIEDGIAQADRGETRDWESVRRELRARFVDRNAPNG